MNISNNYFDKSAITLSTLCLIHCLALPVITILLPNIIATTLNQELFHTVMVVFVVPISIYALVIGCKKHNKMYVAVYGSLGLAALLAAVIFGESHLGEIGEKVMTTIGAIVIALVHIKNYELCKKSDNCSC